MRRHINLAQIWCTLSNGSILFRNRVHQLKTFQSIPHKRQNVYNFKDESSASCNSYNMILLHVCIQSAKCTKANANDYRDVFSPMPGNSCITDSNPPHTNRPINKPPYISLRCQQVWLSIMDCPYSRKTIGFLTEDSMAKLLLRRMTSDH